MSKIKFRYVFAILRQCKLRVVLYKKIKFETWFVYIGKNVKITCEEGTIIIGRKTYISDGVSLKAVKTGSIKIANNCFINENSRIVAYGNIVVGSNSLIADTVSIYDHDHIVASINKNIAEQGYIIKSVTIGNNVWIGSHVVICKGVNIGNYAVIGACALVNKSVPDHTVYAGVPAKKISQKDGLN